MKLHFYGADRCVTGSCHCLEINGKRIDVYKRQAQECVEDYLTFDTGSRSGEFFALRVRGESMLGVGILPDLSLIHILYWQVEGGETEWKTIPANSTPRRKRTRRSTTS